MLIKALRTAGVGPEEDLGVDPIVALRPFGEDGLRPHRSIPHSTHRTRGVKRFVRGSSSPSARCPYWTVMSSVSVSVSST